MDDNAGIRGALEAAFNAGKAVNHLGERIGHLSHGGHEIPVQVRADGSVCVLAEVMASADKMQAGPARRAGTSKHAELDSFIAFVKRFKQTPSVVFADPSAHRVLAVLDYHPEGADLNAAGWGEHRASYDCPKSRQWLTWCVASDMDHRQEAFSDFLEANAEDIAEAHGYPVALALLELARNLIVNTKGTFEKRIDPRTGESSLVNKLENSEGSTPIPRAFMLGIPVFESGVRYLVECRVRFRLQNGTPIFAFHMHRRADFERDAFLDVRKELAEKTGLPIFAGTPEV